MDHMLFCFHPQQVRILCTDSNTCCGSYLNISSDLIELNNVKVVTKLKILTPLKMKTKQ